MRCSTSAVMRFEGSSWGSPAQLDRAPMNPDEPSGAQTKPCSASSDAMCGDLPRRDAPPVTTHPSVDDEDSALIAVIDSVQHERAQGQARLDATPGVHHELGTRQA